MTNSGAVESKNLQGFQEPRIHSAHGKSVLTTGPEVEELANSCGLFLDPWQSLVLNEIHGVRRNRKLTYPEVALIVARQNGKGTVLEATELGWLFLSKEELILHSAHEFKTAADAYKRIASLIKANGELSSQVKSFSESHGKEGIKMKDGRELKFIARSQGSGRGFPAKKIVLDEAYNITDAEMSAMLPTLKAAIDPQVLFMSSAVNKEIHFNGRVLSRIRRRGLDIDSPDPLLWYGEWSAPEGCPHNMVGEKVPCLACLADPERWRQANPGMGIRISMESMQRDLKLLSAKTFACEDLSIGDWPGEDEDELVIPVKSWLERQDKDSRVKGKVCFSVDVGPMGKSASVSVAGMNSQGNYHVEVIDNKAGTRWLVRRLTDLTKRHENYGVVVDLRSHTAGIVADLKAAGIEVIEINTGGVVQAFSGFCNKVLHLHNIVHPEQPSVVTALKGATVRSVGDAQAWDRKHATVDITGLVSMTNALWGYIDAVAQEVDVVGSVW